ncbi:MAG: rhodanese-like domain-containing protein [Elsteraceae bacterium]
MSAPLPLEIDCATLSAWAKEPDAPVILDVREPWEVAICALPNSINIPLSAIPSRFSEIPEDRRVVALCHHGMRSLQATRWLRGRDMDNIVNLQGGIDAWSRQIDSTVPIY